MASPSQTQALEGGQALAAADPTLAAAATSLACKLDALPELKAHATRAAPTTSEVLSADSGVSGGGHTGLCGVG